MLPESMTPEVAKWLMDNWIENKDSGIQAIWLEPDDFEALKKLAGE